MSPRIAAFLSAAAKYIGRPYVWRGKGPFLWSKRGLEPHTFTEPVFDCSGLVTVSLLEVGGPDLRATHNAQVMFDTFPEAADPRARGVLRFYGSTPKTVSHVAICTGLAAHDPRERVAVLEAAGGDSRTLAPTPGAYVRFGVERRSDFQGARSIPW